MTTSRSLGVVYLGAFILLSSHGCAHAQTAVAHPSNGQTGARAAAKVEAASSDSLSIDWSDADSVLRIAVPRTMRNHRAAMAFTYGISYRNRNFTPGGKLLTDYSAKYEVIFVGGLPYRRQVEENRKPLSGQDAVDEQRRFDQTFAERSRMTIEQKRDYLKRPWNVDVPLPMLVDLFTSKVTGGETIDGREAVVIESAPRGDIHPSDEEQRRAMHKRVKLWIDRADLIVSRIEATLVNDDASMKAGTVATIDFLRKDGVWLPAQSDVRFEAPDGDGIIRGETQEVNGDFHRFRVDVRLLEPGQSVTDNTPQAQ